MKKIVSIICLLGVLLPTALLAQNRQIKGKVTDETGVAVSDATVSVKGSQLKTKTNDDGTFSISVPSTQQDVELTVTHINITTQTLKATGDNVSVSVKRNQKQMNEVVVVGYGTQKKRNVTGAVAIYNAENLDERPVSRVDQALIGQMAGVQVKQTSGAPGKPFSIAIRGNGSISANNEPLYVIDGFPITNEGVNGAGNFDNGSPLDNINPNDIESIQVLKDAASAAIYGSRAANGVVLITTKKGTKGKNQITVNGYAGTTKEVRRMDLLDGQQWVNRAKEFIDYNWVNSAPGRTADQTNDEKRAILNLAPGQYNVSYMYDDRWDMPGHPGLDYVDWQDKMFQTGNFYNVQLSASGGNEFARYYISGNYQDQDGFVKGMGYKNYSARANMEVNLSKKMKFGLNLAPTFSIKDDPGVEGKDNTLHKIVSQAPVQESDNMSDNGSYIDRYAWGGSAADETGRLNRISQARMFRTLATAYFDLEIAKGLVAKSTFNFDNVDNNTKGYVPSATIASISGSYSSYRRQTYVNENTITYTKKIQRLHNINVVAGQAYSNYKIDKVSLASNGNFTNTSTTTLPAGSPGSTTEQRAVLLSYFGRVMYDYDTKYLLSASIRTDGSSRFGPDYRWGTFPSLSVGWRISQEKFFNVKQINDLKLRASVGASGNNNIGNYAWMAELKNFNYTFGGTAAQGMGQANMPNSDLRWEKSYSYNYGLDVAAFNNRITASFDLYRKNSKDLLLNIPVLASSGFTNYLTNIGEVLNKGWEVELTSKNITGKEVQWTTSLNLSHNENILQKLDDDQTRIEVKPNFGEVPFFLMQVGLPVNSIYVVKQNGVLTADDIAKGYPMLNTQKVGDPRYVDYSGDGKITAADRQVVGSPYPDYVWGITNTVKYKGFDLSVLVQGQNGGNIYSLFGRAMNLTGMSSTQNAQDVDVKTRGNYKTSFGSIPNTDWLYSSDYVSIRSINLGYDLSKVFKSKFIKSARAYLSAENWFYWDKYDGGYNPEATNANLSGDTNFPTPGDYGGLPVAKSMVLGLNFGF